MALTEGISNGKKNEEAVQDLDLFIEPEHHTKEYKNRIYEVQYERFGYSGLPADKGTIEVLGEKKATAKSLVDQIKQNNRGIFVGMKGIIFQFFDNMHNYTDQGKRVLVTSSEMGFEND